ncbi:mucin-5AC isoform X2 [Coregonus clupeaformis]|uniref:mucin-5AC isoform X2 n=1 Tax=Coregonus clupeaformis TaxID=59861 RepID=UPI001BDFDC76|nr:mucin-5AC isoform X2 [Coregonus clupeaformis]
MKPKYTQPKKEKKRFQEEGGDNVRESSHLAAFPAPSHAGEGAMTLPQNAQTTALPPPGLNRKYPLKQPTLSAKIKIWMPVQETWKGEPYDKPLLKYTTALPIGRRHCRPRPIKQPIPNPSPNLTDKRVKFKHPEATLRFIPVRPDLEQLARQRTLPGGQLVRPVTPRPPSRKQPPSADHSPLDGIRSHRSLAKAQAAGGEDRGGGGDGVSLSRAVRDLQLLSSSSDDEDSESPSESQFRSTTPAYLTRRYQNSLKWYQVVRSEKKTKHHKERLDQLCYKEASDESNAETGPSGVQARHTAPLGAGEGRSVCKPYQGGKRRRSPLSEKGCLPPNQVRRWDRRSWRRQLDSSASDSPASDGSVMLSPPYTHSPFLSPTATSTPPLPAPLCNTSPNIPIFSPSFSLSTPSSCPSTPLYPHSFTSSAPGTPLRSQVTSSSAPCTPVRTKLFTSSAPCTPQHGTFHRASSFHIRSNISGRRTTCCGLESCPPAAKGTVTSSNPKDSVTSPKDRCQADNTPYPDMFNIKGDTAKKDDSEMRMSSEIKKTSTPKKTTEKCSPARAKTSVSSHASPTLKESKIPQADPRLLKPMKPSASPDVSSTVPDCGTPIPGSKLTSIFSYPYDVPQIKSSPLKSPKKSPCKSSPQSTTAHQKHKSPQDKKSPKKSPKTKTSDSPKLTPAPSLSEKQTDKTECNFKKPSKPQSVVSSEADSAVSQHVLSTKNTKSQSAGSQPTNKTSPPCDPSLKTKGSANTACVPKPKEDSGRKERPPLPSLRRLKQAFTSLCQQRPVVAKPSSELNGAPTDIPRLFKTPLSKTPSPKTPNKPQSRGLYRSTRDPRIRDPIQDQSPSMHPTSSTSSSSSNNPEGRPAASTSILGRSLELKMSQGFQKPDTPRPKSYSPKSKPTGLSTSYRGTGTPFLGSEGNLTSISTSRILATPHDCPSQTRSSLSKASYSAKLLREGERDREREGDRERWERERERWERERERWERERCPPSPTHPHPAQGPVPQPSKEGHPKECFRGTGKGKTTKGQEDLRTKVKIPWAPTQKPSTSHKSWPNVPSPCQNPPPVRNGPQSHSKKITGTHSPSAQTKSEVPREKIDSQPIRSPPTTQKVPQDPVSPPLSPRSRPGPSSVELIHAIVSAMGYLLGVPPTSIPGLCPSPEEPGTSSNTDPSAFHSDPSQPPWTEELRLIRQRLSEPGLGLNPQPPNPNHTQPTSRPKDTHTGQREERPAQSMAPPLRKNTKM